LSVNPLGPSAKAFSLTLRLLTSTYNYRTRLFRAATILFLASITGGSSVGGFLCIIGNYSGRYWLLISHSWFINSFKVTLSYGLRLTIPRIKLLAKIGKSFGKEILTSRMFFYMIFFVYSLGPCTTKGVFPVIN
jgi:hypothetical protein